MTGSTFCIGSSGSEFVPEAPNSNIAYGGGAIWNSGTYGQTVDGSLGRAGGGSTHWTVAGYNPGGELAVHNLRNSREHRLRVLVDGDYHHERLLHLEHHNESTRG